MTSHLSDVMRRNQLNDAGLSHAIYSNHQANIVRIVTLCISTFSVTAGLLAVFWFMRMQRHFRHSLIMSMVISDLVKDLNYMAFAIVNLKTDIQTTSPYCAVSGFIGQASTEMTDFAVLFIVLHMTWQVLGPKTSNRSEGGLVEYSKYVFACIMCIPLLTASLAFVNPDRGYVVAGAFCALPIRPFWYRLALAWIPRYLIATTIVTLSIFIEVKVRKTQREIAAIQVSAIGLHNSASLLEEGIITPMRSQSLNGGSYRGRGSEETGAPNEDHSKPRQHVRRTSVAPIKLPALDTCYEVTPGSPTPGLTSPIDATPADSPTKASHGEDSYFSVLPSRRPSLAHLIASPAATLTVPKRAERPTSMTRLSSSHSINSMYSADHSRSASDTRMSFQDVLSLPPPPGMGPVVDPFAHRCGSTTVPRRSMSLADCARRTVSYCSSFGAHGEEPEVDAATLSLTRRHRHVQRQLRLLYVYPILYLLVWACPFILHCLQYSDKYAQTPPFPLVILTSTSVMSFGFVNSLVFCLREKPWQCIPDTDGTIMGSFKMGGSRPTLETYNGEKI